MSKRNLRSHAAHRLGAEGDGATGLAPCELPSEQLDPESELVREMLEELDDVIFAAITGDATALAEAKSLWPRVVSEIGFELAEESQEQYLRYAIEAIRHFESQEAHSPERAIAALEVISLLAKSA